MKFIKVQTDRETQQIQKGGTRQTNLKKTTMDYNDDFIEMFLKTVYFDILVMLGKHILILFDTNEAVILSSINHCLQSLKRNLKQRLCQLFYLFIFFWRGGGSGGDGGQGVLWEMCKLQMLMFTFVIFFDPTRYTYGKGAKGRANIQLYFDYYSRGKRPALAKDIAVSTDYFFTILTKTVYFY